MASTVKINHIEQKVLSVLAQGVEYDFGFLGFAGIMSRTHLDRKAVRRACRSLARKGLAVYERGLWNDDGDPAGSGYCSTEAGRDLMGKVDE